MTNRAVSATKTLLGRKNKSALTLIETLVVIIIIGILASMGFAAYNGIMEKQKVAEVHGIFYKIKMEYYRRKHEQGQSVLQADWNPNIEAITNPAWQAIRMENPNADPQKHFAYDVWDNAHSAANDPVSENRYVAIAFRRTVQAAYTASIDTDKWIYMDLDTGEEFKSAFYK